MSARLELAMPNMRRWSSLKLCSLLSTTVLAVKAEMYYKAKANKYMSMLAMKWAERKRHRCLSTPGVQCCRG
jgi:hypothetical protein